MAEPLTDKDLRALHLTASHPAEVVDAGGNVVGELPGPLERRLLATVARLQEWVEEAEAQVSGMQEEGCAARGLVENIFNGLTTRGTPVDPVLAQMADATAKLLVEVTVCKHKALAERRKEALVGLRDDLQGRLDASSEGATVADGLVDGEAANRSWHSWLFDVMSTHGDIARAAIEEEWEPKICIALAQGKKASSEEEC